MSIRAQRCYFAGKFQPGNVLRLARWRSIPACSLQEVCAIERRTPHVNENFFRPRLWFRHIVDFQNLRATERSNDNSFHDLTISQGNQCAQPVITQYKSCPKQRAQDYGKQDFEPSCFRPYVRCDSAA